MVLRVGLKKSNDSVICLSSDLLEESHSNHFKINIFSFENTAASADNELINDLEMFDTIIS